MELDFGLHLKVFVCLKGITIRGVQASIFRLKSIDPDCNRHRGSLLTNLRHIFLIFSVDYLLDNTPRTTRVNLQGVIGVRRRERQTVVAAALATLGAYSLVVLLGRIDLRDSLVLVELHDLVLVSEHACELRLVLHLLSVCLIEWAAYNMLIESSVNLLL